MTPSAPSSTAATDHTRSARLIRAGAVTVAGQAAGVLISLGAMIILARLLEPADFGLLAMVYTLTLFIASFRDFGLPMAALQSRTLDHLQASALFWINLPISLGVTLFMILMGPALAWFFSEPRLVPLTAVMSLGVLAPAITNQHEAQLTRQIRFALIVRIDLVCALAAATISISLAILGAGYWALAAGFLTHHTARAAATWVLSGWRPAGLRAARSSRRRVRGLVSLGAYLTGYRVLAHLGHDLDRLLVGYVGGAHALGLYDAALKWARLPLQQFYTPLLGPIVAGLSHARDDAETFRRHARSILTPILAITIPILAFAAVAADSLILILLGAKWTEAIPLFRLLCIGAIALASLKTTKWLFISLGQTKRQFKWGLISSPIFAIALFAAAPWGARGIASAFATAQWALLIPGLAYCLRSAPLSLTQYLSILARPLLTAAVAAAAALIAVLTIAPSASLWHLLLTAAIFSATYAGLWFSLPGGRAAAADALRLARALRPAGRPRPPLPLDVAPAHEGA